MAVVGADARWRAAVAALASLSGAGGVALAAVAAHRVADPSLATAAQFLVMHGAAAIGLAALSASFARPRVALVAASLMLAGVFLFSGDISSRVFFGTRLFPLAAPIGGSLLIGSWFVAAFAAVWALVSHREQ